MAEKKAHAAEKQKYEEAIKLLEAQYISQDIKLNERQQLIVRDEEYAAADAQLVEFQENYSELCEAAKMEQASLLEDQKAKDHLDKEMAVIESIVKAQDIGHIEAIS